MPLKTIPKSPLHFLRFCAWFLLSAIIVNRAEAQDLIVTTKGDSIHCKITEIKEEQYIRYVHLEYEEVKKDFVPLIWVVYYKKDFFPFSEIDIFLAENLERTIEKHRQELAAEHVKKARMQRVGASTSFLFSAGWSKRISNLKNLDYDEETLAYSRALQSGWNFGMGLRFPFTYTVGLGLKYSLFYSSCAQEFIVDTDPNGNPNYFNLKTTQMIHYFAPMLNVNFPNADSTRAVTLGVGIGYQRYKEVTRVEPKITGTGSHFGFNWDIGYDFALSKPVSPFVRFSFYIGNILTATVKQGGSSSTGRLRVPENISRIDLTVGVRLGEKV
jgi:hypothetical protein